MKEDATLRAGGSQGGLSDYERQRAATIAANEAMMATLGLSNYCLSAHAATKSAGGDPDEVRAPTPPTPRIRCHRRHHRCRVTRVGSTARYARLASLSVSWHRAAHPGLSVF